MEEFFIILIALAITLLISWGIAEFFGRAKHIGFGWTLALTASTAFIGGIIALIASPSANDSPTSGGKNYKIWAWVCFVFGALNTLMFNPFAVGFFILGAYLLELSKGEVQNRNPKFYFEKSYVQNKNSSYSSKDNFKEQFSQRERHQRYESNSQRTFNQKFSDLKNLYEKGILSQEEYELKIREFEKSHLESRVKESKEYQQLKNLHDEGFLSSNEFYEKTELLKKGFNKSKSEDRSTRRSSITLKGFKKAVEIYSLGIFRNNEEMIDKLNLKLQNLLGVNNTGNAREFIRTTLDEYNSQLNFHEKVKIISSIGSYSNTRQDMPNAKRFVVKFTDMSETELWYSSYNLYVLIINGEKEYFPNAKECLNYITNNFTSEGEKKERDEEEKNASNFKSDSPGNLSSKGLLFAKANIIIYRLLMVSCMGLYPFLLLFFEEQNILNDYNPNFIWLYWIVGLAFILKFLYDKFLILYISALTVIFTFISVGW